MEILVERKDGVTQEEASCFCIDICNCSDSCDCGFDGCTSVTYD